MSKAKGGVKSYNKIPNPFAEFAASFAALGLLLFLALQSADAWRAANELLRETEPLLAAFKLPIGPVDAPSLPAAAAAAAAISAVLSAAFAANSYLSFHNGVWLGERPSADRTCGSSRLESRPFALRRAFKECGEGEAAPGLVVGSVGSDGGSLLVDDITHALVIGGTGAGKTTSCLAPSIVNLIDSETSFVALDPKGELRDLTAAYAESRKGYKLVSIDFTDAKTSCGWNPLQPAIDCAKGLNGRLPEELSGELRILADTLVPEGRADSPIWAQSARMLFDGIGAYVCESADVPEDARNLSTVAALAALGQDEIKRLVEKLPCGSAARLTLESVAFAPEDTFGGFRSNLAAALDAYADPSLSPMLARSDFSLEDFVDSKVALYVRFDSSSRAYDALVAAFVSQTMSGLRRLAERRCGGALPNEVFWILEEFPQLPAIPGLGKAVSIVRSAGMRLVFCCQDLSQIEAVYKEHAPAILNNLRTTLFLAGSDQKTCKHFSEQLGSYTVEARSRSTSKNPAGAGSSKSAGCREAKLFHLEDLQKWDHSIGHLVIKDGRAYACGSLPISKTYAGDELGLGGKEPGPAKRAAMAPRRAVRNAKPAKAWRPTDGSEAKPPHAPVVSKAEDPRFL